LNLPVGTFQFQMQKYIGPRYLSAGIRIRIHPEGENPRKLFLDEHILQSTELTQEMLLDCFNKALARFGLEAKNIEVLEVNWDEVHSSHITFQQAINSLICGICADL